MDEATRTSEMGTQRRIPSNEVGWYSVTQKIVLPYLRLQSLNLAAEADNFEQPESG
jgi:hypothetical protein